MFVSPRPATHRLRLFPAKSWRTNSRPEAGSRCLETPDPCRPRASLSATASPRCCRQLCAPRARCPCRAPWCRRPCPPPRRPRTRTSPSGPWTASCCSPRSTGWSSSSSTRAKTTGGSGQYFFIYQIFFGCGGADKLLLSPLLPPPIQTSALTTNTCTQCRAGAAGQIVSVARSGINYDRIPVPSVLYIQHLTFAVSQGDQRAAGRGVEESADRGAGGLLTKSQGMLSSGDKNLNQNVTITIQLSRSWLTSRRSCTPTAGSGRGRCPRPLPRRRARRGGCPTPSPTPPHTGSSTPSHSSLQPGARITGTQCF